MTKCRLQMSQLIKSNFFLKLNKKQMKKSQSNDEILLIKSGSRKRSYQNVPQLKRQSLNVLLNSKSDQTKFNENDSNKEL